MDIHKNLEKIGLTEKQARVYFACLQLGTASALKIAGQAELKRPTVYVILEELEKLSLVNRTQKNNKTFFIASDPNALLARLDGQRATTQELLPFLRSIHNVNPAKPNIRTSEGMQGVKNAYNTIYTYLLAHPQEELIIFGSLKDAQENFEGQVLELFYRNLGKSKNPVREIGNPDSETRSYHRQAKKLNPRHEIRLGHEPLGF